MHFCAVLLQGCFFFFFLFGWQLSRATSLVRNFEQMSIICTRAREYAPVATQRISLLGWALPSEHRSIASSCKVHTLKVLLVKIFASETANQLLSIVALSVNDKKERHSSNKKITTPERCYASKRARRTTIQSVPTERNANGTGFTCVANSLRVAVVCVSNMGLLLRSTFSCGCCASLLGNGQPTDRWVRYFGGRTYGSGRAHGPATASSKRTAPFGRWVWDGRKLTSIRGKVHLLCASAF